jgi:hypothetical protein
MSVCSCAPSTPSASRFFALYHIQNQNNTDAITSDSLPRHPGTPENAHAVTYIE